MKRKLLRFLISQRVPSGSPGRRTDTLASQRKLPSCMLPSQMPIHCTSACSALAYATASSELVRSGSETISSSGVPARFRSMPVMPWKSSCRLLPASSSRCARVSRTLTSPRVGDTMSTWPPATTGISNCEIW